jgi:g-D-glutamyl-meso-diaminopimelate peptidase
MKRSRIRIAVTCVLVICLLTGCSGSAKKKKEDAKADYAFCEHIVSISSLVQESDSANLVRDAEGFIAVKENVYVNTESLNIREQANTESRLIGMAAYGTKLLRTGVGQDGWDRVEYEGETCFVSHELVTAVPIQSDKMFDYSSAALTIVETKHQQYTYDDLCTDLNELRENFGSRMKLNTIGMTADNRCIFEIVIGTANAKKDLYFVAGVCGAEYMTSLVMMKQAEYYLHYYDAGYYNGYSYADLFDNVRIHIVPMLNPDSTEISQHYLAGIRKKQIVTNLKEWYDRDQSNGGINLNLDNYLQFFFANANGVDLRRNFPYQWDLADTAAYPGSKDYRGDSGGSEAEVKAIIHSIKVTNPTLVVVYHTTGSRILSNYGQTEEVLKDAKDFSTALGKMMTYEPTDKKVIEDGYGTLAGYCNNMLRIPALTVQLGNGSAPLSLNEFNAIWNACRESFAALQVKLIAW